MARRCVHAGTPSYMPEVCLTRLQLHEQEEILSMWGPDVPVVAPPTAARWFSIAVLGFVTFGECCTPTELGIADVGDEEYYTGVAIEGQNEE